MLDKDGKFLSISHNTNQQTCRQTLFKRVQSLSISARSSAWIERWPPEPKVTGSNPVGRATLTTN